MDKILKAVPLEDYKLEIITSSGISGIFDVKPYLGGSALLFMQTIAAIDFYDSHV